MKTLILLIISLCSAVWLQAQTPGQRGGGPGREKIIQMRVEYMRDNLGLSEAEQKKFLPVYEENLRLDEQARQKQRGHMRQIKQNYAGMSDADLEKALNDGLVQEQAILDTKKARFEQYKKLIPLKKIVELQILERSFNKMLLEKIRGVKQEGADKMLKE